MSDVCAFAFFCDQDFWDSQFRNVTRRIKAFHQTLPASECTDGGNDSPGESRGRHQGHGGAGHQAQTVEQKHSHLRVCPGGVSSTLTITTLSSLTFLLGVAFDDLKQRRLTCKKTCGGKNKTCWINLGSALYFHIFKYFITDKA